MIAHLEGKILFKGSRSIILETGGIGYRVFVSPETIRSIPAMGESCVLFTHQYVRETALELYGFSTMAELEFFETLINISGIGPKTALSILGVAPLDVLRRAIAVGDASHLTKVSGIGRKTAEKIVIELADKMRGEADVSGGASENEETIDALVSLGYTTREARDAVRNIPEGLEGTKARVAAALKSLAQKR